MKKRGAVNVAPASRRLSRGRLARARRKSYPRHFSIALPKDLAFGWRSAFSAAIKLLASERALAPEVHFAIFLHPFTTSPRKPSR
jgi:hypothetical protein